MISLKHHDRQEILIYVDDNVPHGKCVVLDTSTGQSALVPLQDILDVDLDELFPTESDDG